MPITKIVSFPKLHIDVEYVIGKNAQENFDIIDDAEDHHIWFHVHGHSSSHVIAKLDIELNKKIFDILLNKEQYYVSNIPS